MHEVHESDDLARQEDIAAEPRAYGDEPEPRGRQRPRRLGLAIAAVLVVVGSLVATPFVLVMFGDVPLSAATPRLERSLEAQLPAGHSVGIGDALLRRSGRTGELTLELRDVVVHRPDGGQVFTVPRAAIGVDVPALLTGRLTARSLRVIEPELTFLESDGRLMVLPDVSGTAPQAGASSSWELSTLLEAAGPLFAMLDDSGGMADLEEVGVEDARILVRHEENETRTLGPLTLLLRREGEADTIGFSAALAREGMQPARLDGTLRQVGGGLGLDVSLENLDADEFQALFPGSLPFEATSAIGGAVSATVDGEGSLVSASLDIDVGPGHFGPADGNKLFIDELTVAAAWDRTTGRLTIKPSTLIAGENRGTLSGEVVVPKRGDFGYGTWPVRLDLTNVRIADPRSDWPAVFPLVSVEALYLRARNLLNIHRLDIASPEAAASLVGVVGGGRETPAIRLAGSSAPIPVRALKSLWPPFLGKGARAWTVKNIHDGLVSEARLTVDIGPDEIASALRGKPLPERAYSLDFKLEDVSFGYLGDMPPVTGANATATLSPRTFDLRLTDPAELAVGRGDITVTGGRFFVEDLRPDPSTGQINLSLSGGAGAIAELLNYEPLKLPARRGIDPSDIGGQADVDVSLVMPLAENVRFADVDVDARGQVTDFSAEGLAEGRSITEGDVTITVSDEFFTAEGTAKLDGVEADLSLRQPLEEGQGETARTVSMVLDEAARERMGLSLGGLLSGPVEAIVHDIAATDKGATQRIELDLTRARLHLAEIGLDKPAGERAKADFLLSQHADGVSIGELVLTANGLRIEGEAEIDREGNLVDLSLPVFELANGTDVAISGGTEKGRRVFRLTGETLDLKPALAGVTAPDTAAESAGPPTTVEFDIKRALGKNRRAIADFIGSISTGKSGLQLVDVSGVVGSGAPLTVSYRRGADGALSVQSGDAGAVLAFTGIYDHIEGGRLAIRAQPGAGGALVGSLAVDDFSISNDPDVSRLIETGEGGQASRDTSRPSRPEAPIDPENVELDRMEAQFVVADGRIDVRNGLVRGIAVGATVEGVVGLREGRLDLNGTYVPLYAINNLFRKVPIFGALLGGRRNEGLLGITYAVHGSLESPDFTINPLSVVTPGVFRYIFGFDNPRAMQDRDIPSRSNPMR